jgi:hypothetical protein
MRIPPWRIALTGGAIVVLLVAGVAAVAASAPGAATAPTNLAAAPAASGAPDAPARHGGIRDRIGGLWGGRIARAASHFVDGTFTFTDHDGNLVTFQIDHGTIAAIGSSSITIDEAGGHQVTVSTDTTTVVRLGGGAGVGKLSDLKAGDQVFVQSRIDGSTTLAKHILRVPPKT